MDPNAPLTAQQFTQVIWAIVLGFAAPWVVIIPAFLLIMRWRDRRALRRAQARWQAWQTAHPHEPPQDDVMRRWQIRNQLWLDSQPVYIHAHLLRQRLEEAEREVRVQAILEAARWGDADGR